MAVQVRVEPVSRDVAAVFSSDLSPVAQQRAFVTLARVEKAAAAERNRVALGREAPVTTIVDGRPGASEDTARVPGTIIYDFEISTNIVAQVVALLRQAAPVRKGRYRDSIAVYVDGVEVDTEAVPAEFDEVVILSTVAYARKIEKGRSSMAPNGVFQVVAEVASKRFSRMASIRFSFASPLGGGTHLEQWAGGTKQGSRRVPRGSNRGEAARGDWNRRQPAIRIRLR